MCPDIFLRLLYALRHVCLFLSRAVHRCEYLSQAITSSFHCTWDSKTFRSIRTFRQPFSRLDLAIKKKPMTQDHSGCRMSRNEQPRLADDSQRIWSRLRSLSRLFSIPALASKSFTITYSWIFSRFPALERRRDDWLSAELCLCTGPLHLSLPWPFLK